MAPDEAAPPAPAQRAPFANREFGMRVASALVLGAAVLGSLVIGGWAFAAVWLIAGIVGAGVQVVAFAQDAGRYFDLHHSADDTLDKIDPKELAQNVAVWAAFLYTVADSDIDFRKTASEAK